MDHTLNVTIPFETPRQALIAQRTLEPDPELRPNEFSQQFTAVDNKLVAEFSAVSARNLRVGVNSFFEAVQLILETMDTFDSPQ